MTRERPIIFSAPMVRAILDGRKTQTRRIVKQPLVIDAAESWCEPILASRATRLGPSRIGRERVGFMCHTNDGPDLDDSIKMFCPYGQPGARLWVRESLRPWTQDGSVLAYAADDQVFEAETGERWPVSTEKRRFIPSIHMPRWASRITLEVTGVRVERLQDISEADALAEGCKAHPYPGPWWQGYRDIDGELLHQQAIGDSPPAWMIEPHRMVDRPHLDRSARDAFQTLWWSIHGTDSWAANPWVWIVEFRRIAA